MHPSICNLNETTIAKFNDAVSIDRVFATVGDHNQVFTYVTGELVEQFQYLGACFLVQVAGRFVSQYQNRIMHQSPGNGDALLLAA